MSFVSSKGNILCKLINIDLYEILAIINRAIKGLHCIMRLRYQMFGSVQFGSVRNSHRIYSSDTDGQKYKIKDFFEERI